jgi:hypothetical protein
MWADVRRHRAAVHLERRAVEPDRSEVMLAAPVRAPDILMWIFFVSGSVMLSDSTFS